MAVLPRAPHRHLTRTDNAIDRLNETDDGGFGYDLDSTPEARYLVYTELGPQEANVSSGRFTIGVGGVSEGGTGNVPYSIGVDPSDSPLIGFKPALVETTVGLHNKGVFEPVFADGSVSLQNPSYWYDGGVQEPFWQKPNNTSPNPVPWDQGLTLGFGTIETLSGLV